MKRRDGPGRGRHSRRLGDEAQERHRREAVDGVGEHRSRVDGARRAAATLQEARLRGGPSSGGSVVTLALVAGAPALTGLGVAALVAVLSVVLASAQLAAPAASFAIGGLLGQYVDASIPGGAAGTRAVHLSVQAVPFGLMLVAATATAAGQRSRWLARRRGLVQFGAVLGLAVTLLVVLMGMALSGSAPVASGTITVTYGLRVWPLLLVGAGTWPLAHLIARRDAMRRASVAVLACSGLLALGAVVWIGVALAPGLTLGQWVLATVGAAATCAAIAPNVAAMVIAWGLGSPLLIIVPGDLTGRWAGFFLPEAAAEVPPLWLLPVLLMTSMVVWGLRQPPSLTPQTLTNRVGRLAGAGGLILVVLGWWGSTRLIVDADVPPLLPLPLEGVGVASAPWSLAVPTVMLAVGAGVGMLVAASRAGVRWTQLDARPRWSNVRLDDWLAGRRRALAYWVWPDEDDESVWPTDEGPRSDGYRDAGPQAPGDRAVWVETRRRAGSVRSARPLEAGTWSCMSCHRQRRSAFCPDCGAPRRN